MIHDRWDMKHDMWYMLYDTWYIHIAYNMTCIYIYILYYHIHASSAVPDLDALLRLRPEVPEYLRAKMALILYETCFQMQDVSRCSLKVPVQTVQKVQKSSLKIRSSYHLRIFKTVLQSMAPVPQWSRHFSGPTLREGSAGGGGAVDPVGAGPSRPCLYLENCSQLAGNLGWVV